MKRWNPERRDVEDDDQTPSTGNPGHWAKGAALAVACVVMVVPLVMVVAMIASGLGMKNPAMTTLVFMPLMLFGLSQWVFALPWGLYLRNRGENDTVSGLWTCAGVVTLLNSACVGLLALQD
jgi:hypothetical protein